MLKRVILMARTVRGQITLIILAALLVVISTGDALESWVKRDYNVTQIESTAVRLGAIAEILRASSPQERAIILAYAREAGWEIAMAPKEVVSRFRHSSSSQGRLSALADRLFPPEGDPPLGGWRTFMDNQRVVAQKVDEENVVIASGFPDSLLTSAFLGRGSNYVLAVLVLIVFFFASAISTITEPIRRIAEAATHADAAGDTPIFVERGTAEIVALARALNGRRLRIRSMVDARTRMLRGISHDLRTPLTRLKLRVERLGERPETAALLEDIQQIEALLTESLNYLRNEYADEEPELVDVASIVQTTCSNFSDVGHSISYHGPNKTYGSVSTTVHHSSRSEPLRQCH